MFHVTITILVEDLMHEPEDEYEEQAYISKSQLKRDAQALQELAAELAKLSREQLDKLSLADSLREALGAALTITQHGARKRQLKYIAGLLGREEVAPIRDGLARLQHKSRQATQALHHIEQWRDRLLSEGDAALEPLLVQYPDADCQVLRQLIRNARREQAAAKPPKSARLLFQTLKAAASSRND
ncbi:MAG: DUF615 domain-containing protein [Methylococcaceae bacterium]|nr:MAG: DUF615 domain-containing protein [Methylococcaceae bacterium]